MSELGKKLRKSANKKVCGVCGGIAEYFNIEAWVVRLIWALLVLGYGVGVILYIVMAIVMPNADNADAE